MMGTGTVPAVLTVGHSHHHPDALVALLRRHAVGMLLDVRSDPYSRLHPAFNRGELAATLPAAGVRYEFLGLELGARRVESECYANGRVDYRLIPYSPLFQRGLDRVRAAARDCRVALFCAEEDPLHCHRAVLVFRHLRGESLGLAHVRGDGRLEPHAEAEARLLELVGLPASDLFRTRAELVEDAYDAQGARLGYSRPAAEVGGEP